VILFPSAARLSEISMPPVLFRKLLARLGPSRWALIGAFVEYSGSIRPANDNDWTVLRYDSEIEAFAALFRLLMQQLASRVSGPFSVES
jgi:hypothetical protein